MYESAHSWSLPSHMYMVSAWAADCTDPQDPMSCVGTAMPRNRTAARPTPFAWTATDGRPDSRPDVRENASILGNLVSDFDFH